MADTLSNLKNMAQNSISEAAKPAISFAPTALEQSQQMAQASTGKAATGVADAAVSNIAEQVAEDQTAKQQQQLQQQANLAERGQQAEEEQQYLQLADQELDYRSKGLQIKQEFNSQLSKLIQDFKEKGDDLDIEKSRAAAEQIGFFTRLQNDKYINELKINGAKARLDNKKKFAEAAMESQFDNQLTALQDDFSFKSMINADERNFKIKMENMGLQQAMEILDAELAGNKEAMMWRGIGSLADAGVQAYGTGMFDSETKVSDGLGDTMASSGDYGVASEPTSYKSDTVNPITGIGDVSAGSWDSWRK